MYSYNLGIEEAQIKVFVKHECTTKPILQKREMYQSYALLWYNISFSITNKRSF